MKDITKLAFLFGAGAEGPGNYDIPLGFEYLTESLFNTTLLDKYTYALKEAFSGTYFGNYKYSRHKLSPYRSLSRNFLVAKILSDPDFLVAHSADISVMLTEDAVVELREDNDVNATVEAINFEQLVRMKNKNTDTKKKARARKIALDNELRLIITKQITNHDQIQESLWRSLFEDRNGSIEFNINVGISGEIDRHFHTIVNPVVFGKVNFSKIFNYYWSCYFTIVTAIVKKFCDNKFSKLYWKEGIGLDFGAVTGNIKEFTELLYGIDHTTLHSNTYYNLIRQQLSGNPRIDCKTVLTTNYFSFAESTGCEVAYLNGSLKWFELPEKLSVVDCQQEAVAEELYFPFIFGTSLIKPIVHPVQINEFARFSKG